MEAKLSGRKALIVGGSSGIGRETGLTLTALGAEVAFHGRRSELLEEVVAAAGSGAVVIGELSEPGQPEAIVNDAAAQLGGLDLVVHAASASNLGLVRDLEFDDWARVFATNVFAPALVMQAALHHLPDDGIAAVISSESVGLPFHGLVPYGSSKAALEEMLRGFRLEHPEHRFCCIRVGATPGTDFARDFDLELAADLVQKWVAAGRMAAQLMDVEEVGRAIAEYLATSLLAPSIELQDVILRTPGGPTMKGMEGLMQDLADHQETMG
jgi:NAD(P)-dependent dehydrogenase (short-subunit alcohol dehydrogenase family)